MSKGKRLNPFQHALKRPDTYIGSAKTVYSKTWIFNDDTGAAIQKEIVYNPGLFNIVREIISNSIDNVWRSSGTDTPSKKIQISINSESGEISIWNDGYCIPLEKEIYEYTDPRTNKTIQEEMYPPEVFFGDMFAGTNYNDDEIRKTSGRNGMGAKATNVFSSSFQVECTNTETSSKFSQTYSANGTERSKPKIGSFRGKTGYTRITFKPDYVYFKYPNDTDCRIDRDFILLLKLYAYEVAMITGISVSFKVDDKSYLIKVANLEKYVRLFFPNSSHKSLHIRSPNGDEAVLIEGDEPDIEEERNIPQISFVNGIRTKSGGIHLNAWRDALIPPIVKAFNAKKHHGVSLKASAKTIYPYLHLFVRVEVDRPRFGSQTKDELTEVFGSTGKSIPYKLFTPAKKQVWEKSITEGIKKIMKWAFIASLEEKLLARIDKTVTKSEVSSRINVDPKKLTDANRAGTKDSEKCRLFITEGLSAKAFATRGVSSQGKGGNDFNGSYAIRGKFLNVQNATMREINSNKEVKELKQVLGLQRGLDYSKPENLKKLRYGSVCILTDADDDGIHIRGLLLNYFYTEFRQLMEKPDYLYSFSTPVSSAMLKKAGKKELFYSNPEFKTWYEDNSSIVSDVKYYKGLGSINPKDTPSYFASQKLVKYTMKGDEKKFMDLGFNKKMSDDRKTWITRGMNGDEVYSPADFVYQGDLALSTFVDHQLIIYHKMVLRRALPSIWDGFKESQRKIFYTALVKNYKKTVGLVNMTGAVKELTGYHHGETSLYETTIKMAQGYVGSNNIPLLENDGEFGCLDPNTVVRIWSEYPNRIGFKKAVHVKITDLLVGDDGSPRRISKIVGGKDTMYTISSNENLFESYTVNSVHILTLFYSLHKTIVHPKTKGAPWSLRYIENSDLVVESFDSFEGANAKLKTIPIRDGLVDIDVQRLLLLDNDEFSRYRSVKFDGELVQCGPITLEKVRRGQYIGWHIDGNERFLLYDGTVTHNTRETGGKDAAAPRYISTKAEKIARILFSAQDDPLLERLVEDNKPVEYNFFMPIIPMILVNGASGIASGYSTIIPNYNPMEIVSWIRTWLKNPESVKNIAPLEPWYRGYTGEIEMVKDSNGKIVKWLSKGVLTKTAEAKGRKSERWEVSELPIGLWTKNFEEWLEYLRYGSPPSDSSKKWKKQERMLADYNNYCTSNTVKYELFPTKYFKPDMNTSGNLSNMIKTNSLTNMVVIDENNYPVRFESPEEILKHFCPTRLDYYQKRKDYLLDSLKTDLVKASNRYRFVKSVVDKKIDLHQTDSELNKYLASMNFVSLITSNDLDGYDYLLGMQFRSMTVRKLEEIAKEKTILEGKIRELEPKTPKRMWGDDLAKFESAYVGYEKSRSDTKNA